MGLAANAARMIARKGETMTLKRSGTANISVKAKRGDQSTTEMVGSVDDATFQIRISNTEIAASAAPSQAPRQGDTIGGYRIMDCEARKDGETIAFYVLTVAGGSGS